jgi:molybdopterin converting factor small subunit
MPPESESTALIRIHVSLRLVLFKDDVELDVPVGTTLIQAVKRFSEHCEEKARDLIQDSSGKLKVLTLINNERAGHDKILKKGDRLSLVALVSGG